jgi:AcrR family transcriptional regulator
MGSAGHGADPAAADLTARARIRDAALLQFAERGVKGATIRGIAEAAGVSAGLVQHHFGSKDELRAACDSYAAEVLWSTGDQATAGAMADPDFISVTLRAAMPVRRYVARALADGSPAAATLFDKLVELTERYLEHPPPGVARPRTSDLHAYAAAMTAMSVGVVVLHEHLSRVLDVDTLTVEGLPRLGLAMLEVLDDRILSPELVAQARAAFDHHPAARTPAATPPTSGER